MRFIAGFGVGAVFGAAVLAVSGFLAQPRQPIADASLKSSIATLARRFDSLEALLQAACAPRPQVDDVDGEVMPEGVIRTELSPPKTVTASTVGQGVDADLRRLLSVFWLCMCDGGSGIKSTLTDRGRSPFEPGVLELVEQAYADLRALDPGLPSGGLQLQMMWDQISRLEAALRGKQATSGDGDRDAEELKARLQSLRKSFPPGADQFERRREEIVATLRASL